MPSKKERELKLQEAWKGVERPEMLQRLPDESDIDFMKRVYAFNAKGDGDDEVNKELEEWHRMIEEEQRKNKS